MLLFLWVQQHILNCCNFACFSNVLEKSDSIEFEKVRSLKTFQSSVCQCFHQVTDIFTPGDKTYLGHLLRVILRDFVIIGAGERAVESTIVKLPQGCSQGMTSWQTQFLNPWNKESKSGKGRCVWGHTLNPCNQDKTWRGATSLGPCHVLGTSTGPELTSLTCRLAFFPPFPCSELKVSHIREKSSGFLLVSVL